MFKIDIRNDNQKKSTLNENVITPRDFVSIDYNPYDLGKKVKPKIEILDSAKQSVNISDIEFSNMIPSMEESAVDSYIEIATSRMKEEPTVLLESCRPIRYAGVHKERIKEILLNYVSEELFEDNCDYFRKSDVKTEALLSERGAFRAIGLYLVRPKTHKKEKHSKHILRIIFVDPYHLFIPSKHEELTAEEYRTKTYSTIRNYSRHIGDLMI